VALVAAPHITEKCDVILKTGSTLLYRNVRHQRRTDQVIASVRFQFTKQASQQLEKNAKPCFLVFERKRLKL